MWKSSASSIPQPIYNFGSFPQETRGGRVARGNQILPYALTFCAYAVSRCPQYLAVISVAHGQVCTHTYIKGKAHESLLRSIA